MTIEMILSVLGWAALLNVCMLLFWFFMLIWAGDWVYRMHGRWFPMSRETFNKINYMGIALYEMATFMFFILPYLALRIIV